MSLSPRETRAAFAAMVVVPLVFLLAVGLPAVLHPAQSYSEEVSVPVFAGSGSGPVSNFSFHGVLFRFWNYAMAGPGSSLNFSGTEQGGSTYGSLFALGGPPHVNNSWASWTAPDGKFSVGLWFGYSVQPTPFLVRLTVAA